MTSVIVVESINGHLIEIGGKLSCMAIRAILCVYVCVCVVCILVCELCVVCIRMSVVCVGVLYAF